MRTSKKDVDQAVTVLNNILSQNGSQERVNAEGRYGYIGLDRYDLEDRCQGTLKTGLTKREATMFLDAMIAGIDLFTRKAKE
jgi:hypothetical protein